MKKLILYLIVISFCIGIVSAATDLDWYLVDTWNISANVTSPQSLDYNGALLVLDSDGSVLFVDTTGNVLRSENSSGYASDASAISFFNTTQILVFNESERYFEVNSSLYTQNLTSFALEGTGNNLTGKGVTADGICINSTHVFIADKSNDAIHTVTISSTGLINVSSLSISSVSTDVADIDCRDNGDFIYILDPVDKRVHMINKAGTLLTSINIQSLILDSTQFQGVAVDSSGTDLYLLNNDTDSIYHLRQGVRTFNYPVVVINTPSIVTHVNKSDGTHNLQVNFTASYLNSTNASIIINELGNCSILLNGTLNVSDSTIVNNNTGNFHLFNITLQPGDYTYDIECCLNSTFGGCRKAGRQNINFDVYPHIFYLSPSFALFYNTDTNQLIWNSSSDSSSLVYNLTLAKNKPYHLTLFWENSTGNRTILLDGVSAANDLEYNNSATSTKFFLGSRNHSGQANHGQLEGIIDYFRIGNTHVTDKFSLNSWSSNWETSFKEFVKWDYLGYFFQFKVILNRIINTELPVELLINLSYKTDLINVSSPVDWLDFPFTSGTDSEVPAGQTSSKPIYNISNYGDTTINVSVKSSSSFDSCFTVRLFNASSPLNTSESLLSLSTTAQTFEHTLTAGEFKGVWMNVTASGCAPGAEAFDIIWDVVE